MKAYRMGPDGMPQASIDYRVLADLTWQLCGTRDGDVICVDRVGGGRHHIVHPQREHIFVLLPGDTNYMAVRERE